LRIFNEARMQLLTVVHQ